ncbi:MULTISPECIES: DUF4870 domain-containing protein [unclassified Chryseobacterium]|uniref:DUF4870 domain-containing protein n=1 Tax=unclassified Chryseobacterium TaxID=2593645 RepID=UPI000D379338|nr:MULTISPECIES: import component protein [unclassified Chryseobacterium]PTT70926.1 import component protein [Chryseobacterium sp. HMWF001]PVV55228.1 import component protein [Chryseobacterium sp. HMWF035]
MSKNRLAIISYITIIGWLVAYFITNSNKRDSFIKYHLKQSFGIFISQFAFGIIAGILTSIIPSLSFINYFGIVFLILWIFGIINAINSMEMPIPVIGKIFENQFSFIK